jgi:hypothetical protein
MLVQASLRVTLLELLGWVAYETGTGAAPGLRSTNLAFHVFHLPALPLGYDGSINQMLEGREEGGQPNLSGNGTASWHQY